MSMLELIKRSLSGGEEKTPNKKKAKIDKQERFDIEDKQEEGLVAENDDNENGSESDDDDDNADVDWTKKLYKMVKGVRSDLKKIDARIDKLEKSTTERNIEIIKDVRTVTEKVNKWN